ncbi:MAG: hypothetical protein ABR563_15165, partial [Pyrinomonadaceae bacterium]
MTPHRLLLVVAFTFLIPPAARAQQEPAAGQKPGQGGAPADASVAVIAAAAQDRVRFSAPNSVVRLLLEVYDDAGRAVFDTEQRGNVLDWHLEDGAGARLADGQYLCVLTVKDLSGHIRQKLGVVTLGGKTAAVQPFEQSQLTAQQSQAVGPVEAGAALTVVGADDAAAATVLAHDGADGQLSRTRGALRFTVGDFFTGGDREQMRLTEEGNLGVGTKRPQARLDVAGDIRTSGAITAGGGIRFSDGTALTSAVGRGSKLAPGGAVSPLASGAGTQNQLAKWTDNSGALGDSALTELSGRVGIGTANPSFKLD